MFWNCDRMWLLGKTSTLVLEKYRRLACTDFMIPLFLLFLIILLLLYVPSVLSFLLPVLSSDTESRRHRRPRPSLPWCWLLFCPCLWASPSQCCLVGTSTSFSRRKRPLSSTKTRRIDRGLGNGERWANSRKTEPIIYNSVWYAFPPYRSTNTRRDGWNPSEGFLGIKSKGLREKGV